MESKNLTHMVGCHAEANLRTNNAFDMHIITRDCDCGNDTLRGPIVDRLHEFEKLGYEPEELRKFIEEHRRKKAWEIAANSLYGTMLKIGEDDQMKAIENLDISKMYPRTMIMMPTRSNGKTIAMEELKRYIDTDIALVRKVAERWEKVNPHLPKKGFPEIKDVIFNKPATIVFWSDGSKTVVKAQDGEPYDPEKGLAMAIAKKALGNDRNYWPKMAKHLKKAKKQGVTSDVEACRKISRESFDNLRKHLDDDHSSAMFAYEPLKAILENPKATKAQIIAVIEDAVGHLGEILV